MRVQLQPVSQSQNTITYRPVTISNSQEHTTQTVQAHLPQHSTAQPYLSNRQFTQPHTSDVSYGQFGVMQHQPTPFIQSFAPSNPMNQPYPLQPITGQSFMPIQQSGWGNWAPAQPTFTQSFIPTPQYAGANWIPVQQQSFMPQQQAFIQQSSIIQPNVDLSETSSEVVLACELPYTDQRNLNLSLNDNSVSIQAYSGQGFYHRVVSLPTDIRPELCEATFTNGVLEIKMPKTSQGRRKVNVNETQQQ